MAGVFLSAFFLCYNTLAQAAIERSEVFVTPDQGDTPGQADIIIEFENKILLQGYSPVNEGKFLRINVRLLDNVDNAVGFFEETVKIPKADRVPRATATYSYTDNQVKVIFSENTRFSVRLGSNGRMLIISVPLLPGPARAAEKAPSPPSSASEAPSAAPAPAVVVPPSKVTEPAIAQPKSETPAAAVPAPPASEPGATASAPAPTAPPAAPAPEDVEKLAKALMQDALKAQETKSWPTVINRCYRVLGLPANSQTEPAQALVGEAREANGEINKARAEYELYLKQFPKGPNAARVQARLAGLPKQSLAPQVARKRELPKERGPAEWTAFGSIGTTYYNGSSQTDTSTLATGVVPATQTSLSLTDQKSLITSTNLNARRRDAFSDTRIVFRDTDNRDYLRSSRSYNRIYSAYVDHNDRKNGYYVRAGRQNPNGLGVLERFDGAQGGYNLGDKFRVNAVYGEAVEFDSPFKKKFYGGSVELLPDAGRPGASLYVIDQTLDGYENRRAVGSEARYFDGHVTAYGLLDYDVLYKEVNIGLLQANYLTDGGTNYFVVLDHRKAPSLALTNALLSTPGLSLQQIIASQGLEGTRKIVKAVTADSDLFNLGVTYPLTERWQIGGDYRLTRISATQRVTAIVPLSVVGSCVGTVDVINNTCVFDTASQAASGKTHTYTAQITGSNLFKANAVGLGNASYINAPTFNAQSYNLTYLFPIVQNFNLDSNLRYYTQRDNQGATQTRTSASFKLSYQWRSALFLEGEYGQEIADSASATQNDHSKRDYFYTGLRYEFR